MARGDLSPGSVHWDGATRIELALDPHPSEVPEDLAALHGREALEAVGYLAPEQVDGGRPGPRSDVFTIGIMLYEAATGEHPFADARGDEIAANVKHHDPRPPGQLRRELAVEWDGIVSCCLHKQGEQRYASALDVQQQIEKLARTGGTRRKDLRIRWDRIAVVLLLLGGVAAITWWILSR